MATLKGNKRFLQRYANPGVECFLIILYMWIIVRAKCVNLWWTHTMQDTDDVLWNCPRKTYVINQCHSNKLN